MSILYFYIFLLVHPYLAMWFKSFEQADRKSWEALIPVYNYYVAFKIGCKKPFWSLLLIFPGVHLVMWSVANVSYIRRFGYYTLLDTFQGIFFPYIIMAKIATSGDKALPETNWANSKEVSEREWGDHLVLFLTVPVLGHIVALAIAAVTRAQPGKKTKVKEWGDSLLFALVAASIIRTYVFEPFQIPTGSMEKTLLVGDFLFVNKLAYGPKVPVTPLSYPLVHNTIPWINVKSYTALEKGKYTRLPGFSDVKRNDVVVFNYPSGDTAVYDPRMPMGLMGHDYHGIVIAESYRIFQNSSEGKQYINKASNFYSDSVSTVNGRRPENAQITDDSIRYLIQNYAYKKYFEKIDFWKNEARKRIAVDKVTFSGAEGVDIKHAGVIYRPVDKRENYIKRCVGIPGDFIEIKNSILYVNDKRGFVAPNQNLLYICPNYKRLDDERMMDKYGIDAYSDYAYQGSVFIGIHTNLKAIEKLRKDNPEVTFELSTSAQYSDIEGRKPSYIEMFENMQMFPKDPYINNTNTDFTRFQIPAKGQTVKIDKSNIAWYRRIISAYEGHKLEERKDGIYIDGKKSTSYTFAMNYYWMMGDNRFNSADSRVWGFVPEDHIVGKASMVWYSNDPNPKNGIRWNRMFTAIK